LQHRRPLFYTVCGVAINSLKISLILQPARSDVKIGSGYARENRLLGGRVLDN